jgi:ATP-dependent RNA helicase DDX10/DBP4
MYEGDEDNNFAAGPALTSADEDDGYISPEFNLPSSSDNDNAPPPSKRSKKSNKKVHKYEGTRGLGDLEDNEALVLRLLRGG